MSDNVTPMPEPKRLASRRSPLSPEERLERVAAQLTRLASEFPQAMAWVEAEVEALRSEVRNSLKTIAEWATADREQLATQMALLNETVGAMGDALVALRDEVIARTHPSGAPPGPAPGRGPGGSGLGLPPRRSG
ncbi:MAG: hypothetical protein ACRD12_05175 [Acidimicrobiales bacterium]